MRTALTETCVYHVRYPSIGPELRRQAIHSSSNICRAVLSVEARLHCQLLVWRENNVPAEVANVGESCMQRSANMLDCTDRSSINSNSNSFNLFLCILAALLSNHVCMDVFLLHFYLITYVWMYSWCTYHHLCLLRLGNFALHRQESRGVLPLLPLVQPAVRSQLQASTRRESRQCKLLWRIVS